jgi:hypothetical protein
MPDKHSTVSLPHFIITVTSFVYHFFGNFNTDDLENYAISGEYLRLNSPPTLRTSFETRLMGFRCYLEKIKPGLSIGRGYSIPRP